MSVSAAEISKIDATIDGGVLNVPVTEYLFIQKGKVQTDSSGKIKISESSKISASSKKITIGEFGITDLKMTIT